MIPVNAIFPEFVPDQVLTSENLNNLFGYMDEQGRMTRTNLIGIGIVCGLNITTATGGTAITISKGCGITSEGYLITVNEKTYTSVADFDPVKERYYDRFVDSSTKKVKQIAGVPIALQELRAPTDRDDGRTTTPISGALLAGKVVMLFVELLKVGSKNCNPDSCDDKGVNIEVNIRPLLVAAADVNAFGLLGSGGSAVVTDKFVAMEEIRMKRFDVPATGPVTTKNIFDAYKKVLSVTFLRKVEDVLSKAYGQFRPFLGNEFRSDPFLSREPVAEAFKASETLTGRFFAGDFFLNPFRNLSEDLAIIPNGSASLNQLINIQYFYDFVADLIAAYDEFRTTGTQILTTCCPDSTLFPRHLLLGEAISSGASTSAYRHYFNYSPLFSQQDLLGNLKNLFRRLVSLYQNFDLLADNGKAGAALAGGTKILPAIRITPSKLGDVFLSEKAIPFYYKVNAGAPPLYTIWDSEKQNQGKANYNLSYHADSYLPAPPDFILNPLEYDLEPYNFLRIEGHIGRDFKEVFTTIKNIKEQNRLPFDIVILKTGSPALIPVPQKIAPTRAATGTRAVGATTPIAGAADFTRAGTSFASLPIATAAGFTSFVPTATGASLPGFSPTAFDRALPGGIISPLPLPGPDAEQEDNCCTGDLEINYDLERGEWEAVTDRVIEHINTNKAVAVTVIGATAVTVYLALLENSKKLLPNDLPSFIKSFTTFITIFDQVELDTIKIRDIFADEQIFSGGVNVTEKFVVHFDELIISCQKDAFRMLNEAYIRRSNGLLSKQYFSTYIKANPGIQHKAGVPMGGTFIIVYHENPKPLTKTDIAVGGATGVTGTGVTGTGVTGTGVTGTGVTGTGVTGTGVTGTGVIGTGVTGTGVIGTGVIGTGVIGTGVTGTGVTGTGVTAIGASGIGATLSRGATEAITPADSEITGAAATPIAGVTAAGMTGFTASPITATRFTAASFQPSFNSMQSFIDDIVKLRDSGANVTQLQDKVKDFATIIAADRIIVKDITDTLADGIVIADFFVPYSCCSDCTPVQFVIGDINDNKPPVARPGDNISVQLPVSIATLDGSSSSDPDGIIKTYLWEFESSVPSTAPKPNILSPAANKTDISGLTEGVHIFKLTVTDDDGATDTDSVVVTVLAAANVPPVAIAKATPSSVTVPAGGTVTSVLDGSDSFDTDGTIVAYLWEYISLIKPEPEAPVIQNANAKTTNVTFSKAGSYLFRLTVTDNKGASHFTDITITANAPANRPPIAVANAMPAVVTLPATGNAATVLSPAGSSDPDGDTITFAWAVATATTGVVIGSPDTSGAANVSFSRSGTFTFILTVTDSKGATATATTIVTVNPRANRPPVAAAAATPNNVTLSATTGTATSALSASGSFDPDGDSITFAWTLPTGTTGAVINTPNASGAANVTFTKDGTYVFTLTVTDSKGATATATTGVTVNPRPNRAPLAMASTNPTTVILPATGGTATAQLLATGSSDPDGDALTFNWETSAISGVVIGNPNAVGTAIATFSKTGSYDFTLTVKDVKGASANSTVKIDVQQDKTPTKDCGAGLGSISAEFEATESVDPQNFSLFIENNDAVAAFYDTVKSEGIATLPVNAQLSFFVDKRIELELPKWVETLSRLIQQGRFISLSLYMLHTHARLAYYIACIQDTDIDKALVKMGFSLEVIADTLVKIKQFLIDFSQEEKNMLKKLLLTTEQERNRVVSNGEQALKPKYLAMLNAIINNLSSMQL